MDKKLQKFFCKLGRYGHGQMYYLKVKFIKLLGIVGKAICILANAASLSKEYTGWWVKWYNP